MKLEVRKARAAAVAANLAAQEAAQNAADALDPEEALEDDSILYAFQQANDALEEACDQADELVSLAEEANHEIRR